MAGQGIERREVMRMIALASVASGFPGFRRWAFACAHDGPQGGAPTRADAFKPQFFTAEEFRLVDLLAELIIPEDDSPGAHDAGVAEFIDFMVASGADLSHNDKSEKTEDRFRSGLKWINSRSQSVYGHVLVECTSEQQTELLEHLAYKKNFRAGEEKGQRFFKLMRDYTVKGYYTSRIGLEALGYPGLQTMWAEMPGCPHTDDPEHLHLPPPVV